MKEGFAGNVNENEMEKDHFNEIGTARPAARSGGDDCACKCNQ
ncbi:hypothetical protein [Methanorbis furvi]